MSDDALGTLMRVLAEAVQPLADAFASPVEFAAFAGEMGWAAEADLDIEAVKRAFGTLPADAGALAGTAVALADALRARDRAALVAAVRAAIPLAQRMHATLGTLKAPGAPAGLPEALTDPAFWERFPREVLDHLVYRYLEEHVAALFAPLRVLGVLRPGVVDWDALLALATDPGRALAGAHRSGNEFDTAAFSGAVLDAARVLDLDVGLGDEDALSVPLWWDVDETGPALTIASVALGLVPTPVGLTLLPEATGAVEVELAPDVALDVSGTIEAFAVELRPGDVSVEAGDGSASVAVRSDRAWTPIGAPGGSRLEVSKSHAALHVADDEIKVEAGLDAARVVFDPADLDGFLARFLGPQQLDFAVSVAWSNLTGVTLGGRVGLTAEIPVDELGVDTITVALAGDLARRAAVLAITASGSVALGPLTIAYQGVGLQAALGAPPAGEQGSLGALDARLGFRPPTGVGIALAGGPVTGGGFLAHDETTGEYAGGVELSFRGLLDLTGVGLIGRDGSLVVIITATGFAPIPLGFGFKLTGVGGLVAVDRTVDVGALQAGLRTGSLDAVLFPSGAGPQIVDTLRVVFPPARDRVVFGPMARIEWGAPKPLLRIDLAVLVELPHPVRVMILGRLQALLPDEDHAIVELRMDVLGVIDFDAGRLSVDASLRDSRILALVLTGDVALRMSWGTKPAFLLSAGGFHPRFQPPAGFPELRRIGASLVRGGLTLRLEAYLALTSNTFQLGAHVDVGYSGFGFVVHGTCGFDALVQFSPFHFEVDIDASVSISWHGFNLLAVRLHLGLAGPNPWHAVGSAELDLGWLPSVEFSFDVTFGSRAPEALPEAPDLGTLLHDALADPRAWTPALAAEQRALASAEPFEIPGAIRLHPLARLEVRQRAMPLDTSVDRFGSARLPGTRRFDVRGFVVDGARLAHSTLTGEFAAAQFKTMPDEEKLRRPSFEPMTAGAALAAAPIVHGQGLPATLTYETEVHTEDAVVDVGPTRLSDATLGRIVGASPAAPVPGPLVREQRFVVASTRDLSARSGAATFADAVAAAGARADVQVVPDYLAVAA